MRVCVRAHVRSKSRTNWCPKFLVLVDKFLLCVCVLCVCFFMCGCIGFMFGVFCWFIVIRLAGGGGGRVGLNVSKSGAFSVWQYKGSGLG